ncbi:MAG: carbohydrate binding family 9 domain-containing protein [Bacteroidales bacterium]|nr:carbohydrate binding family 9 domain-containing protein [Bacteroidales bacterium]
MKVFFIFFFTFIVFSVNAQVDRKKSSAARCVVPPRIDGVLNDASWANADPIMDFTQFLPLYGTKPSHPTEVRILYDDYAIYIGAKMKDLYPDSIPMQLGNRDDENMNADYFEIQFDTYDNQLDAYTFSLSVAGVQVDSRVTDDTYDGVWLSEVKVAEDGWIAEMKIPYSALRFPKTSLQNWGLQITRSFRRNREFDQWSLEKQGANNKLVHWGSLTNISDIEPPVRLSLTPYFAMAAEHYPNDPGKDISTSFGGGMDLKFGLNESFTVDMTLLPDFSQVQSDNKIKNLTAFETIYDEQRPFFNEAVDLFEKGDIFYSRRIGKTPLNFLHDSSQLMDGERIIKNPVQQRLINATKLSGRTSSGLAIGLLNAVTANTYAIVEDTGEQQRKILTDPASNYNMIVLAQALKNNSEIFISNTNLVRAKNYRDANVTAAGIKLNDKSNTYSLNINGGVSQIFTPSETGENKNEVGYKFYTGLGKYNGNFLFTILKGMMNDTYNANDMGVNWYNNYHLNYASISYNIYQPWWRLRDIHNTLVLQNENNFTTSKVQKASLDLKSYGSTMKYLTIWVNASYEFLTTYDYYEPRVIGRYYRKPTSLTGNLGFSSDYRKPIALDVTLEVSNTASNHTLQRALSIHPIFRINNHFVFNYSFTSDYTGNQVGYAHHFSNQGVDSIIFGKRDITTIINALSGKYLFRNNLSINLNTRHYWSKGVYKSFYTLNTEGNTVEAPTYSGKHDFNFNVFTVDMVFSWVFAPGSSLNIVWKNAINPPDSNIPVPDFFTNIRNTFNSPQSNTVSFKILYYLDYQQLKRKRQP